MNIKEDGRMRDALLELFRKDTFSEWAKINC
jgi:hypothetical protein